VIRSDREYRFPVAPAALWAAMARTEDFRSWWPWLRAFEGDGLVEGAVWRCVVQPPLPWSLRFTVDLNEVVDGRRATATVAGDIEGTAELTVSAAAEGSTARLVSDLAPASVLLRTAAVAARPLVLWGHDWVLDRGVAQFRRKGLRTAERG